MKLSIGKRMYGTNKFRWFYSPMSKYTKKAEGILIFWWSKTIDVHRKMTELNKMRREKLGTKG